MLAPSSCATGNHAPPMRGEGDVTFLTSFGHFERLARAMIDRRGGEPSLDRQLRKPVDPNAVRGEAMKNHPKHQRPSTARHIIVLVALGALAACGGPGEEEDEGNVAPPCTVVVDKNIDADATWGGGMPILRSQCVRLRQRGARHRAGHAGVVRHGRRA